jgi:hypothetical protein
MLRQLLMLYSTKSSGKNQTPTFICYDKARMEKEKEKIGGGAQRTNSKVISLAS